MSASASRLANSRIVGRNQPCGCDLNTRASATVEASVDWVGGITISPHVAMETFTWPSRADVTSACRPALSPRHARLSSRRNCYSKVRSAERMLGGSSLIRDLVHRVLRKPPPFVVSYRLLGCTGCGLTGEG